jgi:lysozyme
MDIDPLGVMMIKHFEGFVDHVYGPPADVPTIGYGTTMGAGVFKAMPEHCTEAEAELWLIEDCNKNGGPAIEAAAAAGRRLLNRNEIAALFSLGYNLGWGIFEPIHTVGHLLRSAGATITEIADSFTLYDDPGTEFTQGLLTRREVEKATFLRRVGAPNPGGI